MVTPAIVGEKSYYRTVLRVSLPLVLSMAAITVTEFTDRVFLSNYHLDAIAAALPAGITAHLITSLFMGVAAYLSVFVAQYVGAGVDQRVGQVIWQGLYFTVFSAVCLYAISHLGHHIFRWSGHSPGIQQLEVTYFKIVCTGGAAMVFNTVLSAFFLGRGVTRPVLLINVVAMLVNIPLDYVLIFGVGWFPRLGIAGAAIATVTAWCASGCLLALLTFTAANDERYGVLKNRKPRFHMLKRIMVFGVPGALQHSLDVVGFTFFALIMGRVGDTELAVSNMIFSINALAFIPAMGFSQGLSALVGQAIGGGHYDAVPQLTRCTSRLLTAYLTLLALLFVLAPQWVLSLFTMEMAQGAQKSLVVAEGSVLLKIVVFYMFFDARYMVYVGTLKGAGDTRFIMWSVGMLSLAVMILPLYVGIIHLGAGLYFAWSCVTFFVLCLYGVCFYRYRSGKWQTIRLIKRSG
jgi:MATE family multidrug resistance protein